MKKLTPQQWQAARDYLHHQARPLEAARYRFHFEQGSAGEVLAALAAYKNDDGGFGHALEPDLRTAASSALATSVAFQILEEVHAPASHPLVQGALAYLLASYDSATQRWRIIPPEAEDAPRAFWWLAEGLEDRFAHFWLNPRAELLGALWRYAGPVRVPWLAAVTEAVVQAIETRDKPLAGNDLHCVLRLAATPQTPDALRTRLAAPLRQDIEATVVTAPAHWGEYVLRPLEVAATPDAAYAALFPAALQANLDYLIETQGDDGAWLPTWSWAPLDAAAWRKAEREMEGRVDARRAARGGSVGDAWRGEEGWGEGETRRRPCRISNLSISNLSIPCLESFIRELLPVIDRWRREQKRVALATVVRRYGSAPLPLGAKMAISSAGEMAGSVSGGCVEGAVVQEALACLAANRPKLLAYGIADELAQSVGLACGGVIEVFVEPI